MWWRNFLLFTCRDDFWITGKVSKLRVYRTFFNSLSWDKDQSNHHSQSEERKLLQAANWISSYQERGEKWVTKSRFIWVLYLTGWKFGVRFINQSWSVVHTGCESCHLVLTCVTAWTICSLSLLIRRIPGPTLASFNRHRFSSSTVA